MMPARTHSSVQLVVLGNPQSRRVASLMAAAKRLGMARPIVVSYRDYFATPGTLARHLTPGVVLRIEAPSEDWIVTQLLLKRGAEARGQESSSAIFPWQIGARKYEQGEIVAPRQWYLGLVRTMQDLQTMLADHPQVRWMVSPADIPVLFDKRQSQALWQSAGVPVARFWPGIRCYDQLRQLQVRRLFVKLAHGYSAMGAMALQIGGRRVRALTTIELENTSTKTRMFVSKRMRAMLDERAIECLFNRLAKEGVIVEPWLPKSRIDGRGFDIRVVTIRGRPHHVVGRASVSPFTNLNLDARRVDANRLQQRFGPHWAALLQTATCAAAVFSKSHYLGLDVLPSPTRDRFVLLEANAWGDYLPGLLYQGQDTYEAELRWLLPAGPQAKKTETTPCTAH